MANENDDMGLELSSISMFNNNKPSNTSDPLFASSWGPIGSQPTQSLGGSSMASHYHLLMQNQKMGGTSHVSQYQSDPSFVELMPKHTGSGEGCYVPKQQDGKKPKIEHNTGPNSSGKQAAIQDKESSQSGDDPKDNYIHVRAIRGQATNSHSLAERVRREKISERMRLLQELVPGCNKITGKTVMLDEIINYVQSLQQQAEFLSMKLVTVKPELNFNLERVLSKDIIQSRGGSAAIVGFGPGTNSSHAFSPGIFPRTISGIPSTNPQFPSLPQTVLDNELQNLFQMGFYSGLS